MTYSSNKAIVKFQTTFNGSLMKSMIKSIGVLILVSLMTACGGDNSKDTKMDAAREKAQEAATDMKAAGSKVLDSAKTKAKAMEKSASESLNNAKEQASKKAQEMKGDVNQQLDNATDQIKGAVGD